MKKRWPWLLVVLLLVPVGWGGWQVAWEMGYYYDERDASIEAACGVEYHHYMLHKWSDTSTTVHIHWCVDEHDCCYDPWFRGSQLTSVGTVWDDEGWRISPHTFYELDGVALGQQEVERRVTSPPWLCPLPYTQRKVQALVQEAALYVQEQAKAGELTLPEDWEYVD